MVWLVAVFEWHFLLLKRMVLSALRSVVRVSTLFDVFLLLVDHILQILVHHVNVHLLLNMLLIDLLPHGVGTHIVGSTFVPLFPVVFRHIQRLPVFHVRRRVRCHRQFVSILLQLGGIMVHCYRLSAG